MQLISRVILLILLLMGSPVRAQDAPQTEPPRLVFLTMATTPEIAALEQQLITQLQLELDGLKIVQKDMTDTDFANAPLDDRLQTIANPNVHQHGLAVMWIGTPVPETILLNVVALNTGRAYVRIIEATSGPHAAEDLAFSAQELLGQTYMMEPPDKRAPLEPVVSRVLENIPRPARQPRPLVFSMELFGLFQGANPGSWLQIGGGAQVVFQFSNALFFSVAMSGTALPLVDPDDGWVSGSALLPEILLGYTFGPGRVGWGLVAGVQPGFYRLNIEMTDGEKKNTDFFDLMLLGGVDFRVPLTDAISLVVFPGFGFRLHTRDFKRRSDQSSIVATSLVNWRLTSGLQIGF